MVRLKVTFVTYACVLFMKLDATERPALNVFLSVLVIDVHLSNTFASFFTLVNNYQFKAAAGSHDVLCENSWILRAL